MIVLGATRFWFRQRIRIISKSASRERSGGRAPTERLTRFVSIIMLLGVIGVWPNSVCANVVTDWNTIASTTIVAKAGKSSVAASIWFAYTSIAVYDAVNAVHHEFQPFYYSGAAADGASDEAAAVAAAHRVLVH
jgi:hypothetical protein